MTKSGVDQIKTAEWVEWLHHLQIGGLVAIEPSGHLPRTSTTCEFRAAEYNQLHDVVELVLEDEDGLLRVVIEAPLAIWVQHEGTPDERFVFDTDTGQVSLRRVFDSALAAS